MDNVDAAVEASRGAMRTRMLVWMGLFGACLLLLEGVGTAWAAESRRLVDEANTALSDEPSRFGEARRALDAATAAHDDPDAVAEAFFLLGRLDEQDGDYARALPHYRSCVDAAPATRWAFRASDRTDWLRLRSEDDFRPLLRLERVRHDPALASNPGAIDALAHDAQGFPPGMVRVEARMLVAEAWLGRLHRPDDAIAMLRIVTAEPRVDPLTLRLAERELVDALVAQGRIDEAMAETKAQKSRLDAKFVTRVLRLGRRRALRLAAIGILVAFGVLSAAALVRAKRRGRLDEVFRALRSVARATILFVGFAVLAGGLLASQYESGNAQPFFVLGSAVLPLALIARLWGAAGSQLPWARLARSLLCGMTVLAAAFVLLETINPAYLEGFGL